PVRRRADLPLKDRGSQLIAPYLSFFRKGLPPAGASTSSHLATGQRHQAPPRNELGRFPRAVRPGGRHIGLIGSNCRHPCSVHAVRSDTECPMELSTICLSALTSPGGWP